MHVVLCLALYVSRNGIRQAHARRKVKRWFLDDKPEEKEPHKHAFLVVLAATRLLLETQMSKSKWRASKRKEAKGKGGEGFRHADLFEFEYFSLTQLSGGINACSFTPVACHYMGIFSFSSSGLVVTKLRNIIGHEYWSVSSSVMTQSKSPLFF